MKYKLILVLSLVALNSWGAVEYDLIKGIDLTGISRVTPSQLNQLVDAGTINTNKGLVIRSGVRPDITLNPRYTNYIWNDISLGVPGTVKQYICCGDSDTNWIAAFAGLQAITGAQIANNTINSNHLATNSVKQWNIMTNSVTRDQILDGEIINSKLGALAVEGPNIGGSAISNPNVAADAIRTTNIVDGVITGAKIGESQIDGDHIADGAIYSADIAQATITTNNLASSIATNLLNTVGHLNLISPTPSFIGINVASFFPTNIGAINGYQINFSTPYANTNYAFLVIPENALVTGNMKTSQVARKTTSSVFVTTYDHVLATLTTNNTYNLSIMAVGAQ